MKVLQRIMSKIYVVCLALTVLTSLFSIKAVPYCIIVLLIIWLVFERDFTNVYLKLKIIWPSFFYCLLFLIGFFFTEDKGNAIKTLEKQTSFLLFPLLVVYIPWNKERYSWFSKSLSIGVLVICIWSLLMLLYFSYTKQEFVAQMDKNYLQWKLPHLAGYHPTYMGMLIVSISIILVDNAIRHKKKIEVYCSLGTVFFLTVFLLYLSPRMAVSLQFLVFTFFAFKLIVKRHLSPSKLLLIFGGLLLVFLMAIKSSFLVDKFNNSFTQNRFFLWTYAFEEIKENNFVFGEGIGKGQILLEDILKKNFDPRTSYKGTDLHNQYLKNCLDLGIMGFIGVVLLCVFPLVYLRNNTLLLFMITFAIAMLTESMLSLIKGIILFNIMSTLLIRNAVFEKHKY